ncbi:MAG: hypothetical protein K6A32_09340, partial [Bacteroidales bacterium]|nr:hypothetical protein [Bacteroidales bacterium]
MTVISAQAQKIQTVDTDGNPIPLVSVLTEDGVMIGNTDLDGILADVGGLEKVAVTHIAYKPQIVTVASLRERCITMEDIDYGLAEIVVTPKPYLYKEYYFRAFSYIGDSLRAYAAGIIPVAHDIKNNYKPWIRNVWSSGTFANKAVAWHSVGLENRVIKNIKQDSFEPFEKWHKKAKAQDLYHTSLVSDGPNRWRVMIPTKEVVGQIVHTGEFNRTTLNAARLQMYSDEIHHDEKMLRKRQELNYQYKYTAIYKTSDDDDTPDILRHVMTMDNWEYDSGKGRQVEIYYIYTTDYGYVSKDDFKARSKELNKGQSGHMSLAELQAYERSHNIPELSSSQLLAIKALKKGHGKK